MRTTCFGADVLNSERKRILTAVLQEIVDQDKIPFCFRGGRTGLDWMELQRLVDRRAEKEIE